MLDRRLNTSRVREKKAIQPSAPQPGAFNDHQFSGWAPEPYLYIECNSSWANDAREILATCCSWFVRGLWATYRRSCCAPLLVSFVCLFDWLSEWVTDWLIGLIWFDLIWFDLIDWLIGWLINWLIDWLCVVVCLSIMFLPMQMFAGMWFMFTGHQWLCTSS